MLSTESQWKPELSYFGVRDRLFPSQNVLLWNRSGLFLLRDKAREKQRQDQLRAMAENGELSGNKKKRKSKVRSCSGFMGSVIIFHL